MQQSIYHSILRIAALTLALVLLFDSGLLSPLTRDISKNTQLYLANAVGMYAAVETTELNSLTAELTKQKTELDAREAALRERELSTGVADESSANPFSTYVLSILLFIILMLIILNYVLDFLRQRKIMVLQNE